MDDLGAAKACLDRAMSSYRAVARNLEKFQMACVARDAEAAEKAREDVLSTVGSFMDEYAAAFRA